MRFLRSLLSIVPLTAVTIALPNISSSRNALQPRDDMYSHGIPTNGVSCSTINETNHILDNSTITTAITAGASNQYTASEFGSNNIFYPKLFNSNQLGNDSNGNTYTIKWANPACATGSLLYVPVSYSGFSAPAYSGGSVTVVVGGGTFYPSYPPTPASPISSDIVLFIITSLPNTQATTPLSAEFCAVVTNSDAAPSDMLYVNGQPNISPSGYHQCNPN